MRHPLADTPHASVHRPGPAAARVLLTVVAGLSALTVAAPAAAHDALVGSEPAANATLTQAPTQVVLTFAATQAGVGSEVVVVDGAGQVWSDGPAQVVEATVTQPLVDALPNGTYTVTWRSVAGDGHPVTGAFDFVVDVPAASPSPSPSPSPATPSSTGEPEGPVVSAEPAGTSAEPVEAAAGPADGTSGPPPWLWLAAAGVVALVVLTARGLRRRASHD